VRAHGSGWYLPQKTGGYPVWFPVGTWESRFCLNERPWINGAAEGGSYVVGELAQLRPCPWCWWSRREWIYSTVWHQYPRPGWRANHWGWPGRASQCIEWGGWRELESWKSFSKCAPPRATGAWQPTWRDWCVGGAAAEGERGQH
jgi:hypothetical protein